MRGRNRLGGRWLVGAVAENKEKGVKERFRGLTEGNQQKL